MFRHPLTLIGYALNSIKDSNHESLSTCSNISELEALTIVTPNYFAARHIAKLELLVPHRVIITGITAIGITDIVGYYYQPKPLDIIPDILLVNIDPLPVNFTDALSLKPASPISIMSLRNLLKPQSF